MSDKIAGWVAIDLDGTLAHYEGWDGGKNGAPILPMLARVRGLQRQGVEIRILTARANEAGQIALIQDWCFTHGLGRPVVTASKDYAMIELWDDRAVGVEKNTGRMLSQSIFERASHERIADMKRTLRKLWNLMLYGKWSDCEHSWVPVGFADWKCEKCGVDR